VGLLRHDLLHSGFMIRCDRGRGSMPAKGTARPAETLAHNGYNRCVVGGFPPPISDVAVVPFVPPRHSFSLTVRPREKNLYKWPSWFFTDEEVAEIIGQAQARATYKTILENAAIRLAAAAEEKAARDAEHRKLVKAAGGRKHWELNQEQRRLF
jgi:hypothetical protein